MTRRAKQTTVPLRAVRAMFRDFKRMFDDAIRAHEEREDKKLDRLMDKLLMHGRSFDAVMDAHKVEHAKIEQRVGSLECWRGEIVPNVEQLAGAVKRIEERPIALHPSHSLSKKG